MMNILKSKKLNIFCSFSAFTLAEVLITLGIIGVVAALTIPSLISNYQKHQTVVQLKKEYTVINEAIRMSEIDNGPNSSWDWGGPLGSGLTVRESFDKYLTPYLKILKYCDSLADCGYSTNWTQSNGTTVWVSGGTSTYSQFVAFNDGAVLQINHSYSSPDLRLDINGIKGPNKLGRDLFQFALSDGLIIPVGVNADCTTTSAGQGCAGKIIRDGWQIKDDYPW